MAPLPRPPFQQPVQVEIPPELGDVLPLFEANRTALERELGAPWTAVVGPASSLPGAGARFVLRLGAARAALLLDRDARLLIAEAPERAELFELLSLLRDLHSAPSGAQYLTWCTGAQEAVDRVEKVVGSTWPSFDHQGIDWPALVAAHRPRVEAATEPLEAIRHWLALLGDTHTGVRPVEPPGFLPYRARWQEGSIRLLEVPPGTAGARAGARAGDTLLVDDIENFGHAR